MDKFDSAYLNITDATMKQVAEFSKNWAQVHGICTRLNDQADRSDLARIQAFTLVPSMVPVKLYSQACELQKHFSLLYHRIPYDFHFVHDSLKKVLEVDDFTRNLFQIYENVYEKEHNIAQPVTLTIQRADYMLHCPDEDLSAIENHRNPRKCLLKQVEVNTMASAGAGASYQVAKLHDQVLKRFPDLMPRFPGKLAENQGLNNVARGLLQAWKQYGNCEALALFVVEGLDLNAMDQCMTEYRLSEISAYAIKVIRYTLKQVAENLFVDEKCGRKLKTKYKGQEIGLVYFRSGYAPSQYITEVEWQARSMIERSGAIKCPWVGAHLAGCKKIQQILTNPRVVLDFMGGDMEAVANMTVTFAEIRSLDMDDPASDSAIEQALKEPERYVLKPQREGGGNNLFDLSLAEKLEVASPLELQGYILMDRLRPWIQENVLVRANQPLCISKVDSELGTYGYTLGNSTDILDQAQCGHLLRTKPSADNEGGTIKGTAGHDNPFLIY